MSEKDLRPIERELVEKFRKIDATGRGEMHVIITPEAVDISGGERVRHPRVKK